jgi:lipopolysaccharide/colanic/teichoic acid biosynthesis glycosyltransferase
MRHRGYEIAKRLLDVAAASAALVVTLPVWLVAALAIRIASPGPAFFVQQRVGRWERPFGLLKFRTMAWQPPAADGTLPPAAFVTVANDARVFRVGALLRRWKIDELPQLLNVLAGSMSLVGPRPTVASDYARMTPVQRRRADVPPGITGLAQIHGGAGIPWPERLVWDQRYVLRRGLRLDLMILAATAALLLSGGAPKESPTADEWSEAA